MNTSIRTIAAAAILPAIAASALESRQLSLPAGRSETVDLGFVPSGYKQQSGSDAVSVALAEGASVVTVTGVKEGARSQIEFPDPTGEGVLLTVEVVSDLDETLRKLRRMLSDFDGLQFSKGNSKVLIDGTIGNPSDWAKFSRVLNLSDFQGKTESIVEFSVDPGTIGALRRELEMAGFNLAAPGAKPEEGQLALKYEHNVLAISGNLWAQRGRAAVLSILKGQPWLEIVDKPTRDAASNPIAQCVFTASVDDALLEMGVAFLLISKSDLQQRTSTGRVAVDAAWDGIKDLLLFGGHRSSQHGKWNNVTINSSLQTTIGMLAENGLTRQREYGTFRFHANGDPGKTLHIGGQMTVTPPPSGEGDAPQPQEYEYGFKVINRESRRISSESAEADIEIELFGSPIFRNEGGAIVVDQQRKSVHPTVRIPMGQTVAVAGYESLFENTMGPSGTPLLRNIPIVNWFVSDKKHDYKDLALLFLVSVRKVDIEAEAPMVPNTPMKDITLDADTSTEDRFKAEEAKKNKYRGCLAPLNWFRW